VERFARWGEENGIPRIGGKIIGLLMVSREPLSFDEIAETLKVSRGSVSTNTRFLEQAGVIRRVSRLGERRDLFEIADNVHQRVLEKTLRNQRRALALAEQSRREIPASESYARSSLKNMEEFFTSAIEATEKTLEKLRKK